MNDQYLSEEDSKEIGKSLISKFTAGKPQALRKLNSGLLKQ